MKKLSTIIAAILIFISVNTNAQCVNLATGTFYPKSATPGAVSDSLQLIVSQCNANTFDVYNNGQIYAPGYTINVTGSNPATNSGSKKVAVSPSQIYLFQVKTTDGSCFSNFVAYNFTVLAVKLLSFDASASGNKVTLIWKVDRDQDADHYKIERSINGRDFDEKAILFTDNQTGTKNYSFNDQNVPNGQYFYRLKMVNKDGQIEYSSVVKVSIGSKKSDASITVIPNPVSTSVSLTYDDKQLPSSAKIKIYDAAGRAVLSPSTTNSKADLSSLKPGVYVLEITVIANNTTKTSSTKIIKQ